LTLILYGPSNSIDISSVLTIAQGIDDVLALLLALSATPEEVEVLLISLTFGNIEVEK
jgi:Inosine-uridine nucleoside N-ribohydrolase